MLSDLIKRIKDDFASSRMELINQISVSDAEYEQLLYYVREKVKFTHIQSIIPVDEILSVAMVQIAIRVYSEGNSIQVFIRRKHKGSRFCS